MQTIINPTRHKLHLWTGASFLIVFLFFLILLIRWTLLPNFMDIYYHLLIANEFNQAGGFVTHDFLQYAPLGRPHLYPAFFHFLIMLLIKSGLTPLFIARLTDAIIFPLLLTTIWYFMRTLFYPRVAFFSVLLGASLYSFYLATTNFIPATLALILGLLAIVSEEKDRLISSAILLSLSFYTHVQIPWVMVIAFLLYGIFNRNKLKKCLFILALAITLALPMLFYIFKNKAYYAGGLNYENFVIEFSLIIILLILAIPLECRKNRRYYILLALALSVTPFVKQYPYRFISGQGLIGFIFLAGVGLDNLYATIRKYLAKRNPKENQPLLLVLLIALIIFFSPSVAFKKGKAARLGILNSTYINLITPVNLEAKSQFRPNNFSISSSKFIPELIACIKNNSQSTDIIYSNIELVDAVLASLSNRACAKGMLKEVKPQTKQDPLSDSKLIVWFKYCTNDLDNYLLSLIAQHKLVQIKETQIAYIYNNPTTKSKAKIPKPAVSNRVILGIGVLVICLLIWDLIRPLNKKRLIL